jgi:hypothetical protein
VTEENAVSSEQVKQIAQEALSIESYILRRAWGLGYAVAAVEIALIILFDVSVRFVGLSSDYSLIVRLVFNVTVSVFGVAVVAWVYKKAYGAMLVRREILDSVWARLLRRKWIRLLWIVYYLPVVFALIFLHQVAGVVLYWLLAISVAPFFFGLKISFPEHLPRESITVLATFAFCTLGNFTVFLLTHSIALPFWILLIAVFAVAAVYAHSLKPPTPPEAQSD